MELKVMCQSSQETSTSLKKTNPDRSILHEEDDGIVATKGRKKLLHFQVQTNSTEPTDC